MTDRHVVACRRLDDDQPPTCGAFPSNNFWLQRALPVTFYHHTSDQDCLANGNIVQTKTVAMGLLGIH